MLQHHKKTDVDDEESRGFLPSKRRARTESTKLQKCLLEYRKISVKEGKAEQNANGKKTKTKDY